MTTVSSPVVSRSLFQPLLVGLVVCTLLAGIFYVLLVPARNYANADFMSLWSGGRAILEGVNPYDPDHWLPLRDRYGSSWFPDDTAPFPLWTFILFTPLAVGSVDLAISIWLAITTVLIIGSMLLLLFSNTDNITMSVPRFVALLALIFFSRPYLLVLFTGQITGLLVLAVALFIVLMERGRMFPAGFALSFALLKPNAFVLFAALIGVWLLHRGYWRAILGGISGVVLFLAASWAIQPGWISEWLAVGEKTVVTGQTPTVWGLMWELTGRWWPLTGLAVVIAIAAWSAHFVLRRRDLDVATVTMIGLTLSLVTTPYTWVYEHLLLSIPFVLLYRRYPTSSAIPLVLVALAVIVPWLLYWIATQRGVDTYSSLLPLLVFALCFFYATDRRSLQARSSPA